MKKNVMTRVLQLSENNDPSIRILPVFFQGDFIKGLGANCKSRIVIIFIAIHVLLMSGNAFAHKMMMDAMVNDDGTVLLEAFFPDGSPAKNTKVEIFSPDGSQFMEGTTNADGQFIFTPEKKAGIWKAVTTGQMGHKTSTEFEIVAGVSAEEMARGQDGKRAEELEIRNSELKQKSKRIAHKEPIPWNQIISGFGFIFGISAFVISLKLKADLKKLKNALTSTRD